MQHFHCLQGTVNTLQAFVKSFYISLPAAGDALLAGLFLRNVSNRSTRVLVPEYLFTQGVSGWCAVTGIVLICCIVSLSYCPCILLYLNKAFKDAIKRHHCLLHLSQTTSFNCLWHEMYAIGETEAINRCWHLALNHKLAYHIICFFVLGIFSL